MHLRQRYPLTLALPLGLVLLVLSLTLLDTPAAHTQPALVSASRPAPRPYTVEVPQQCPVSLGYARVAVARDPTLYRSADQNADGAACVRFPSSCIPAAVLIDGHARGRSGPDRCPDHFVRITPEHVPLPELAGDVGWVGEQGHGYACLWEVPGRFGVVVIDNTLND